MCKVGLRYEATRRGERSTEVRLLEKTADGAEADNSHGVKSVTHRGLEGQSTRQIRFISSRRLLKGDAALLEEAARRTTATR